MTHLKLTSILVLCGSAAATTAHGQTNDLTSILECRDAGALTSRSEAVAQLAREAGMQCRTHEHQRETSLNCTGGRIQAFGQSVKEFNLVRGSRDGALLQVAFNGAPGRVGPLVERERSSVSEALPLSTATVDEREDGVAELRCLVAGSGSGLGAIAGRLDFRGVTPMPAMRVCAAPVRAPANPTCIQTRPGDPDYLLEDLSPGDYYVTSYATQNNPNRLFGIHSTRLADCPDGAANCVGRRLQPVTVFPGDVRSGIDPDTLVERLPSPLHNSRMQD